MPLYEDGMWEERAIVQRRAQPGEHVQDLATGVIHAAKLLQEIGGCTWCAYTFYDPAMSKSPVDDFQGKACTDAVTCMDCIAKLSDEEAANEEEDAWRKKHGLL